MSDADAAIITRDLTKTFAIARRHHGRFAALRSLVDPVHEHRTVVDKLTMTVAKGELIALLGPNGAGKSTSIKMLTGILTPTSGEVIVDGRVPHRDRVANARAVGAVFGQKTQLWWDLPAKQSFAILRDIFDVPQAVYDRQLADFDSILALSEFWDTPVRNLSLGQRVRCEMAAAMLHDPAIVFLDEPTIGMDVVVKEQSREFLRAQVEQRGRTIVLTTHDMTEVARLCERVLLINHGRLMFDGSLDDLKAAHGGKPMVNVTFAEPVGALEIPGARVVSHDGMQAVLATVGASTPEDIVRALISRFPVVNIGVEEAHLEDVMRDVYLTTPGDPAGALEPDAPAQTGTRPA
ncbi:MAG: viologen exporter family transport system ATP-binding protein [Actinomycetota bacterium]|nr:viologen exporter family transport system ATP-binding protein [Actinomycetota bacterium]